jgi:hypothetical protein
MDDEEPLTPTRIPGCLGTRGAVRAGEEVHAIVVQGQSPRPIGRSAARSPASGMSGSTMKPYRDESQVRRTSAPEPANLPGIAHLRDVWRSDRWSPSGRTTLPVQVPCCSEGCGTSADRASDAAGPTWDHTVPCPVRAGDSQASTAFEELRPHAAVASGGQSARREILRPVCPPSSSTWNSSAAKSPRGGQPPMRDLEHRTHPTKRPESIAGKDAGDQQSQRQRPPAIARIRK